MLTLRRLTIYLLTFFITLILVLYLGNWKRLDEYLISYSNSSNKDSTIINKKIVFIDLAPDMSGQNQFLSFKLKRQKLVDLIDALAKEAEINRGPKGVVLDLWFTRDSTERKNIIRAIQNLQKHAPVYAAYNLNASTESVEIDSIGFDNLESKHDIDIYNVLSKGSGDEHPGRGRYHTYFYPKNNEAFYENDYRFKSEISVLMGQEDPYVLIESLPLKVVADLDDSNTQSTEEKRRGSLVPYASRNEMEMSTYTFNPDSTLSIKSFRAPEGSDSSITTIDVDHKIVIVGDPKNDIVDLGKIEIPGPHILTWAISDLLDGNTRLKLPIESTSLIIGQMLFFAFFVVMIFSLLFKYIKLSQTKPVLLGILSFTIGFLFLFIYYKVILNFNAVIPVGQPIAAMLITAALSWHFAYKFLATGIAEGSQKYDVFISYSHGNFDWVKKNVFEPLQEFRSPDGKKLNIFFDVKSIGIGEAFTSKYMWGIVDSKVFIPVISEEYYGKNHCKNEMDLAYKRSVEKLLEIKPIVFSYECVPQIYTHINFLDITANPDFMTSIKESLVAE